MKNVRMAALLWLLGFAAEAALLLFLTPVYTAVTWITLAFTAAAFLSQALLWRKGGGDAKSQFFRYPGMTVSGGYLLAQLVICCVFARVPATVKTAVFVNLLVLLIAWMLIVGAALARERIENYYTMAENAYDAGNQKEAESYCNKIIEIDPNNYRAWLLKGRAAGWQSTLANIRIEESVSCFTKAVDNAPDNDKDRVRKEASQEIEKLSTALMKMCCNNFAKFASQDNAASILNNLKLTQLYSLVLLAKCGVMVIQVNTLGRDIFNRGIVSWHCCKLRLV